MPEKVFFRFSVSSDCTLHRAGWRFVAVVSGGRYPDGSEPSLSFPEMHPSIQRQMRFRAPAVCEYRHSMALPHPPDFAPRQAASNRLAPDEIRVRPRDGEVPERVAHAVRVTPRAGEQKALGGLGGLSMRARGWVEAPLGPLGPLGPPGPRVRARTLDPPSRWGFGGPGKTHRFFPASLPASPSPSLPFPSSSPHPPLAGSHVTPHGAACDP